jgi:hypothetical protein
MLVSATSLAALVLLIGGAVSMQSCNKADCCSNFQNIRWCEFDTPDDYDSWEDFKEFLQSQGYACYTQ